ncbi:MAG: hypothetical protein IT443_11870 [Phycisphaeraceae bacterium]|nr:hypothetical protein [Phycisphaeraceae bacterium]
MLQYASQVLFATFTGGPGVDVTLASDTSNARFAGIVSDSSVGSTGGWIDVISPKPGDVIWCRVASGLDAGDGVLMQASGTDQGFADSGAYAAGDIGYCLMDEDAADNPYGTDNLAPICFTSAVV